MCVCVCVCVCVCGRVCGVVVHWHCSAQLSMFNMEKRYRNKIIIIVTIFSTIATTPTICCADGPKITDTDVVVGADLQGSAELRCQVNGSPEPHVIWTRKDSGSPTPRTLSTSSVYR